MSFLNTAVGDTSAASAAVFNGRRVPDFMTSVIADDRHATGRAVAEQAVLSLNASMMTLYDDALVGYKQNLRAHAPIILALFSGSGGEFTLYRPGHEPLVADPVPVVYQLAKSVGHSSMAIYQIVAPYLSDPSNLSWRGPLRSFRTQNETALESLPALDMSSEDREVLQSILQRNIAFMNQCLDKGTFAYQDLQDFTRGVAPFSVKTIGIAAQAQVGHWMSVVESWKKLLGDDWQKTYAVSNSLYVTRQNNILFTILAQFMGQEAMGDRLLLIETPEFTTTPDKMLEVLTRIVADRAIGMLFFRDYFLMDVELLGGGARKAIEAEALRRGMKPLLPTLAPFFSNDWPWKTDPTKGRGPARLEDVQ
jgi:hypothetical protein